MLYFMLVCFGLLAGEAAFSHAPVFAQKSKLGLSPEDQKRYDDLASSARASERIAYIAVIVAIAFVVVVVPISIYFDRKKKLRRQALRAQRESLEAEDSPNKSGREQGM
jgi:hypothetical protein